MCPNSYVYSKADVEKMNSLQIGQAVWEYENDQDIAEMVEDYGGIVEAAAAVVNCFMDADDPSGISEAVTFIMDMGSAELIDCVTAYLEAQL